MGELVLATRGDGEAFTPSEEELLRDLARQSGVAVHAVRVTADLQQARERLVTSREEERRRLRRDLHDGLGPQLASLPLSIEAARILIPRDPEAADTVLRQLREHVQTAIADIRGLVYALRPPQLDDLGLLAAIRGQVDRAAVGSLQICVEASDRLPDLPAAVEVAAFRIVQEALTNVLRHSGARRCIVRIEFTLPPATALRLIVDDDARGLRFVVGGRGLLTRRACIQGCGAPACAVGGLGACATRRADGSGPTSTTARPRRARERTRSVSARPTRHRLAPPT